MRESLKGKNQVKKLGTRKARKRGGVSKYRGISREQICILFAANRKSDIVTQMAGYGRVNGIDIDGVIGECLKDATCFALTWQELYYLCQGKGDRASCLKR